MSEKERKMQNVLNSLKVEGMELTKEEEENVRAKQNGKINKKKFIENAIKIAKGEKK